MLHMNTRRIKVGREQAVRGALSLVAKTIEKKKKRKKEKRKKERENKRKLGLFFSIHLT